MVSPGKAPESLPLLPTTVDEQLVHEAIEFLRGASLPIEPRKKWPREECQCMG